MAEITTEAIKSLRDATGISVMECKKALEAADGDMKTARILLQEQAATTLSKKADRTLAAGTVASYIHNTGQVGALVLLLCETDFVSKNEEFITLARNIAMHVAAMRPDDGKMLLTQSFIKDESNTIADLIAHATQKFGERIVIETFTVFSV